IRDQPATSAAASNAGHSTHTQRLVCVAMSLQCSPPIMSSATRQTNGPSAKTSSKNPASASDLLPLPLPSGPWPRPRPIQLLSHSLLKALAESRLGAHGSMVQLGLDHRQPPIKPRLYRGQRRPRKDFFALFQGNLFVFAHQPPPAVL